MRCSMTRGRPAQVITWSESAAARVFEQLFPSVILAGKAWAYPSEAPTGLHSTHSLEYWQIVKLTIVRN